MSFTDPALLRGESFAYALSRVGQFNDTGDFVESVSLDLYIDEEGTVNLAGKLLSYAGSDPIDCTDVPTFSPDNNFVQGLSQVLPGVPVGAILGYGTGLRRTDLPPGYGFCDGSVYKLPDGSEWVTPYLITPPRRYSASIQKLPTGAVFTGKKRIPYTPPGGISS